MRTYPFISNYLQSSGWELASRTIGCSTLFDPYRPERCRGERKQLIEIIDHPLSAVRGKLQYARVHADSIFRAGFYAESAENAQAQIDVKAHRIFLNLRIGMLSCHDVDTAGRTNTLTHHTGHAAR